jgi:hypothetical protein
VEERKRCQTEDATPEISAAQFGKGQGNRVARWVTRSGCSWDGTAGAKVVEGSYRLYVPLPAMGKCISGERTGRILPEGRRGRSQGPSPSAVVRIALFTATHFADDLPMMWFGETVGEGWSVAWTSVKIGVAGLQAKISVKCTSQRWH